jgi:phosphonate transport system substrate-binding protein
MITKKTVALFICAFMAASLLVSCSKRSGKIGSKENPIQFYFMPLKGEKVFKKNAPMIEQYLENKTGLAIETVAAPSFVSIIKKFGSKKADFAFMNTLGYLLARDWAKAEACLMYIYGDVYRTYRGEILVRTDSGIKKAADLNGKTMAFVSPYSAGGYLYPLKYLADHKVKPSKEYFAGNHLQAVEDVYSGKAAAAATYHARPFHGDKKGDARTELTKKHPDILSMLKIIALTDKIPNGPVAVRSELPKEIKTKITDALLEFSNTPNGRKTLMELYNVTGLIKTRDADYDGVQKVVREMGKQIQDMVPGGAPYYKTAIEPGLE